LIPNFLHYTNYYTSEFQYNPIQSTPIYIMPATEVYTIPQQHRGAILNNRDSIQTQYSVTIGFPRNRCWGEYQEMFITGSSKSICMVKKIVNTILAQAQEDYEAYRVRRDRRKREQHHHTPSHTLQNSTPVSSSPKNPFSLLKIEDLHEQPQPQPQPQPAPQPQPQPDEFPQLAPQPQHNMVSWGPDMSLQEDPSTSTWTPLGDWGDETDDDE
jgi:hypothetical protein